MSAQFSPQQIAQQNATFKQEYEAGRISPSQYNAIMTVQNANLAAYNAAQQNPYGDTNRNPDRPLERAPVSQPSTVNVSPIQALTTIAANTSDRAQLVQAKEVFYPQDKNVVGVTYNPTTSVYTATYAPKTVEPPKQVQQSPAFLEPTLGNLLTRPVETISPLLNITQDILIKDQKNPVNQAGLAMVALAGENINGMAIVQNKINSLTNGKAQLTIPFAQPKMPNMNLPSSEKPLPYTPKTEVEQNVSTAYKVGRDVAVTGATIIVAPQVGVSKAAIGIGSAIGAGLNQAPNVIKAVEGQPVTARDIIERGAEGAAEGAVFSLVGSKVMKVTGLEGKTGLPAVASRIGVNTALGGGAGMLVETIETGKNTGQGLLQGAAFGAAFGLAGEAAGAVNAKFDITGKVRTSTQKVQDNFGDYKQDIVQVFSQKPKQPLSQQLPEPPRTVTPIEPSTNFKPYTPKANKPSEFITKLDGKTSEGYLIKMPEKSNLELKPNIPDRTLNSAVAKERMDNLLKTGESKEKSFGLIREASSKPGTNNQLTAIERDLAGIQNSESARIESRLKFLQETNPNKITDSALINKKISGMNFDKEYVGGRIDKVLAEAKAENTSFIDAKIAATLKEAQADQGYLVKMPEQSNLKMNVKIPNRTLNAAEAEAKINAQLNDKSFDASGYTDYHNVMSKGSRTAVKVKDLQLEAIENDLRLNRLLDYSPIKSKMHERVIVAQKPITLGLKQSNGVSKTASPNSSADSSYFNYGNSERLIPEINQSRTLKSAKDKTDSLLRGGISPFTDSFIESRIGSFGGKTKTLQTNRNLTMPYTKQNQESSQNQKARVEPTIEPTISTRPTIYIGQDVAIKQDTGIGQTTDSLPVISQDVIPRMGNLPFYGAQANHVGFNEPPLHKHTKAKSYKYENPIMQGFQLLGSEESGESPYF